MIKSNQQAEVETYERIHVVVDGLDEASDESRFFVERELGPLFSGRLRLMSTASKCSSRITLAHLYSFGIGSPFKSKTFVGVGDSGDFISNAKLYILFTMLIFMFGI